jgi:non-ribosomal peptide synthetase component F
VLIPHKAIIDYIDWCVETYSITADDVVANHAPLYFDNSTFDIYTAFKAGATLQLVHAELNAVLPRLVSWIREREISVFFCVPSVLTLLLKSKRLRADSFPKLRHLIFAGEVVHPGVLAEWMNLFPRVQFTNMYGPTEITVDCTYHVVAQPPGADCTSVPIGKARTNMELFVELSSGELSQQVGAGGQLLVRGTSVAYGYLGDVERTTKAFVQNPGNSVFHDTLYRTGDLVRIDPNGDFLFLGRADDQIKFLGYRIELGEIESALLSLPCVAEGVVVFHASAVQDEQEIGALVRKGSEVSETELIELLRPRLPSYMVPTRIRFATDELPKTASGKYDRKRAAEQVFID